MLISTITTRQDGTANVFLLFEGQPFDAHSSHANYKQIVQGILNQDETLDYPTLFNVEATIRTRFERLSDRVTIRDEQVLLDGDPVDGSLQTQILSFLNEGEDFGPLVAFYEKLLTNPLGNVQNGIYEWAKANGMTITEDGNLLGYKGVNAVPGGYTPSRPSRTGEDEVNDVPVGVGNPILQNPGDTVSMPRSIVLNQPSAACGQGLHIGTWDYAHTFGDGTTLLVEFNPRDVVSLPDSNSTWKLRVSRYTVLNVVDEPVTVPVYRALGSMDEAGDNAVVLDTPAKNGLDSLVGSRVEDSDGDEGVIERDGRGGYTVVYDNPAYSWPDLILDHVTDDESDEDTVFLLTGESESTDHMTGDVTITDSHGGTRRKHGKGGPTSQAAKGNGLNPAQDPKSGQFVNGRPGSSRSTSTGRFSA